MLEQAARALCKYDDARLRTLVGKDPLTTEDALMWRCFDLTYAARLLTDGYGFDSNALVIDFMGDVDGVEVEWTLGAVLNELMLLAEANGYAGHASHGGGGAGGGFGASKVLALLAAALAAFFLAPRFCGGTRSLIRLRGGGRAQLLNKW